MSPRSIFLILLAVVVLFVTIRFGAFVAGGADSSGYLSQARLWEHVNLEVSEPLIQRVDWPFADWTFSPLGFRPGLAKGTIVPIYSVGYPMLMAAIRRVFGAGSEMYLVPITSAGLVVCTALVGEWAGGMLVAILSSLLITTSPPFVLQSLQPMSDVPTAFWWTLATLLCLRRGALPAFGAGLAVLFAVLTRPNLAPLAVPLAVFALRPGSTNDESRSTRNWTSAAVVMVAAAFAAAIVAYINLRLYGSPGRSGYGTAGDLYQFSFGPLNVVRYSGWLLRTETVLIIVAFAALLVEATRSASRHFAVLTLSAGIIVTLSYIFYLPFDNWTYLRFFLPVYPLLFVALARFPIRRSVIVAVACLMIAWHINFIARNEVFKTQPWEQKYLRVTDYIRRVMPPNALFIGHQYTGSIRYYTDRPILRYDWLPPNRLDSAVQTLETLGYKPYFLLEDWEEPFFQRRFGDYSSLAKLDWYPSVEFRDNKVRIYDPGKRPAK